MMNTKADDPRLQLSAVLHEIRNPLTLIQSYLQLFEKKYPDACQDLCWQTAADELLYLRDLLRDISAYHGEIKLKKEPVSMTDWLLAYAKTISPLFAPHSEILLTISIAGDLPVLMIDAGRMRQLMDNLVRNGIEAIQNSSAAEPLKASGRLPSTPYAFEREAAATQMPFPAAGAPVLDTADGARACVALSAYMTGNILCIAVTDTGRGVSSDMRDRLFTPFCTGKPEGTGLGLPICRKIAELHGGQLTLSFSGRGKTQFLLSLPAQNRR